ncbi:MAG: DSD1 family PLP-dependent enzyme [Lautropia sp.]|nr:MAG: DSD1 family PLP-dependent enzyme [Pseudomonadota bacterium]MBC6960080.1 DSD1 family PLP-dependent enzyme [Lautropia sp.]MCL4702338.1 DSD1 family PLP-dependent enzyme [Burkholderiaceae bacterium]MCZ2412862.1 DSD1 family PLP-dependent enzyme [Burkholderiales bacterium]MDL1907597.1 DSD1 family PLP-dependent enzyme [Betaproteobacteria bacterium PRO1]
MSSGNSASAPPAAPGDPLGRVDTPALVLDLDAFEANVAALHAHAAARGVRVRAHGKAHRCPEISRRQVAAGAVGVCCQKVGEAEGFAEAGIADILVSNEIVDPAKLERLARLARRVRLAVCVDHPGAVAALARACRQAQARIDVLIELDVGQGRCGVATIDEVMALARAVAAAAPALRLRGLQAYHGSAQHLRTVQARSQAIAGAARRAALARDTLRSAGFGCDEVSGGGTGTFAYEVASGVYTEIQPGSYALMDLDYRANEPDAAAPAMRQAIGVMMSVMSVRAAHAVLDGGLKAVSVDSGLPALRLPGWRVRGVSDEHTVIEPLEAGRTVPAGEGSSAPAPLLSHLPVPGQRCVLDPGHCDPTVNLHDWVVAYRGDRVEAVWPVLPRDASR